MLQPLSLLPPLGLGQVPGGKGACLAGLIFRPKRRIIGTAGLFAIALGSHHAG